MEQIKNKFDIVTIKKTLRGAAIAGGGVALLYILEALTLMDFGDYTALAVGILSVVINAVREFLKGNKSS